MDRIVHLSPTMEVQFATLRQAASLHDRARPSVVRPSHAEDLRKIEHIETEREARPRPFCGVTAAPRGALERPADLDLRSRERPVGMLRRSSSSLLSRRRPGADQPSHPRATDAATVAPFRSRRGSPYRRGTSHEPESWRRLRRGSPASRGSQSIPNVSLLPVPPWSSAMHTISKCPRPSPFIRRSSPEARNS